MTAPSQLSALVFLSVFYLSSFLHSFEEFTLLYCYCIYRHSHCRSDTWLVCLSHVMVNPHPKSSISALHFSRVADLTVSTVKHGLPQHCRAFDVLYNDQVNSSYSRGCLCMQMCRCTDECDVWMNEWSGCQTGVLTLFHIPASTQPLMWQTDSRPRFPTLFPCFPLFQPDRIWISFTIDTKSG